MTDRASEARLLRLLWEMWSQGLGRPVALECEGNIQTEVSKKAILLIGYHSHL